MRHKRLAVMARQTPTPAHAGRSIQTPFQCMSEQGYA
jgi:hypothetical protein